MDTIKVGMTSGWEIGCLKREIFKRGRGRSMRSYCGY
jgi:hypothetical protein